MKKAVFLFIVMLLCSCGVQKELPRQNESSGPRVQDTFYRCKFGDSPLRVYSKLAGYGASSLKDGTLSMNNQVFAGQTWHYINLYFAEKMFSSIIFTQDYNSEAEAIRQFDTFYDMLSLKYGKLNSTSSDNRFSFTDSKDNIVSIELTSGASQYGMPVWYCSLMYAWGPGLDLIGLKSLSEL